MKQIFILLFISLATITLTSCSNSAERAIEKVQAFEKDILVLEARNLEHTSEQRIDFYKKLYNLDDIDFISIFPLLDHWEDEADQIIDKNDEEFDEEYNALRDRKEALIEQIDNRLEQIGFYD
jgi:sulfatase maturation enzyme AslB (radical SAM superfamily)